jgi:Holliday junction resolvase YEN1
MLHFLTAQIISDITCSIWLVQCCAVFRYAHHNAGENPEMRALFYRLCRLFRLHAVVVFVFDGTQRAEVKRGKKVKKTPHWLEQGFIEMLKLFGFIVHQVASHYSWSSNDRAQSYCIAGTS